MLCRVRAVNEPVNTQNLCLKASCTAYPGRCCMHLHVWRVLKKRFSSTHKTLQALLLEGSRSDLSIARLLVLQNWKVLPDRLTFLQLAVA